MNPTAFRAACAAGLMAALLMAQAGCTNLDRSRDLANPRVSPQVTARQVCSNCHGVDGNSVSPNFPRLAGQQPQYIEEQLKSFRSHHRSDPAGYEYMWGISRSLTDEQIAGLARYFASQKPKSNEPVDAATIAAGRKIFEQGIPDEETPPCMACHGPQAQGMAAFPRLAGQHCDYLIKQLHVFQETEGRPGTPMKAVTHKMTGPEMKAIAGFLQALPPEAPPEAGGDARDKGNAP